MTQAEIREMFLLAAKARAVPPCDPRREAAEAALSELESRYFAENVEWPDGARTEPSAPSKEDALKYVAALFLELDGMDPSGREARKAYWKALAPEKKEKPEANAPGPEGTIEP